MKNQTTFLFFLLTSQLRSGLTLWMAYRLARHLHILDFKESGVRLISKTVNSILKYSSLSFPPCSVHNLYFGAAIVRK